MAREGRTRTGPRSPGPGLFGACCPSTHLASPPPPPLSLPQCLGAAAALGAPVSGVELDSLISQVKDLLPDLGEGFILACLEHYGYDPEQVINNILEERLAPALRQLDRGLDRWGDRGGGSRRPPARGPARGACGPRQGPVFAPLRPTLPPLVSQDSARSRPRALFPDH